MYHASLAVKMFSGMAQSKRERPQSAGDVQNHTDNKRQRTNNNNVAPQELSNLDVLTGGPVDPRKRSVAGQSMQQPAAQEQASHQQADPAAQQQQHVSHNVELASFVIYILHASSR